LAYFLIFSTWGSQGQVQHQSQLAMYPLWKKIHGRNYSLINDKMRFTCLLTDN